MASQAINAKKTAIMQATEAGKETELRRMRESTPKHASSMITIPIGTYNQEVSERCRDERAIFTVNQ